jgi:pimeloyl-ACP methyl ester carboxylesterase
MSVGKASGGPRTWFTGHSDGSQLAQLAALKHATDFGADSVGGVLLFGPSRVGSVGFATYFNTLLGDRTVYYAYGRDPASATDFTNAQVPVPCRAALHAHGAVAVHTVAAEAVAARRGSNPGSSCPPPQLSKPHRV